MIPLYASVVLMGGAKFVAEILSINYNAALFILTDHNCGLRRHGWFKGFDVSRCGVSGLDHVFRHVKRHDPHSNHQAGCPYLRSLSKLERKPLSPVISQNVLITTLLLSQVMPLTKKAPVQRQSTLCPERFRVLSLWIFLLHTSLHSQSSFVATCNCLTEQFISLCILGNI